MQIPHPGYVFTELRNVCTQVLAPVPVQVDAVYAHGPMKP